MKKLITIFAILICIFGTSISIADAEDEVINSQMDSFNISNFIDEANKYSNDILKDIDIQELLNNAIKGELDTNQLLKKYFSSSRHRNKRSIKSYGKYINNCINT